MTAFTFVLNHVLQSTLFASGAALLALAFQANHARSRCWLWLAASVKFLVPFAALIALGKQFAWRGAHASPHFAFMLIREDFAGPIGHAQIRLGAPAPALLSLVPVIPQILLGIWFCGFAAVIFRWWLRWRRIHAAVRSATPLTEGRELEALRGLEQTGSIRRPIGLLSSTAGLEPGIFGIVRPALLWPAGISERLTDTQLNAILAHEICHARRRDNLTATIHMLVEAVFWFHPLVWWLGARLVDERERACDEEVLRLGSEPEAYAESILKTCKFHIESPLVCMAGVTGSDLKKRIERIMTHRVSKQLDLGKKLLLAAAAFSAIAAPIGFGVVSATPIRAQAQFSTAKPIIEAISIKRNTSGERNSMFAMPLGERLTATNVSARMLIAMAYDLKPRQLSGGPDWLESEKYDIEAKTGAPANHDQMRLTMQALLADRFKLAIHRDPKEMPIYALVASKGASKLRPAGGDGEGKSQFRIGIGVGLLNLHGASMAELADALSRVVGRNVIDRTGIAGSFDVKLEWTPDERRGRMPEDAGPSLFTAIQEQLGLKLEDQKGPVDVVVIDHVEKPSQD